MLLLFAMLLLALVLNLAIGSVRLRPAEILSLLKNGRDASTESLIIFDLRMPRMLLARYSAARSRYRDFCSRAFSGTP